MNARRAFLKRLAGLVAAAKTLGGDFVVLQAKPAGATVDPARLDDSVLDALIDQNRKGDFVIRLARKNGGAAPNSELKYKMTRLHFDLGTVLYRSMYQRPESDPDRQRYLERIDKYFNTVTIIMYWNVLEPEPGKHNADPYLTICRWCRDHGKKVFGHGIFYGYRGYDDSDPADEDKLFVQPWVRALKKEQLEEAMKRHLRYVLTTFDGKISDYVLSNEVGVGERPADYFSEAFGFKSLEPYFRWANALAPKVRFYVNENSILGGKSAPRYVEMVQALMGTGVIVGGIGDQGHLFIDRAPSNKDAWQVLDQLAVLKLPILVTEFGIQTTNEQQYADDIRRFYRVCFAHPGVIGLNRFGIWAPEMWPRKKALADSTQLRRVPEAPLWRKDWSPTPAADVHINLVTKEWTSNGSGRADQRGDLKFRGFFGKYEVEVAEKKYPVEFAPAKRTATITLA